ncbi:hypothetical protein THMA_1266 [Thermotoga maritima MSB8]|uniref:Uncharacterized protein n=1 Tax=Thermotoga maritima (strain ATCC 43589 / DSM 3109 / JCM 10099 / NBRC 100826 / MSB8) TaxID=243274 RepID=Q9X0W8_THEMA|nr:hypothetical protein [Thermotoga maritima]AAD36316.1 hypothetical protein TM_1241 [Thermotoga maritima MSB8]AGL50171.1 hypothetical protein Tmari_1247 [Thermotoga maritima MSB8]AHD18853.1 hypothetical protein THEMA_08130 [Thermotoga maritima MSB8]AKE27151.1 hypothetical protein THMC_1266 [Thermotoga maritima]AKE29016.1 hypothetical protein THMA_1266 [Thermotoga maritima MSB8]
MDFRYILRIHISEEAAEEILNNSKIQKRASEVKNKLYYDNALVIESEPGYDVDEDLIMMVITAYGKPAKAEGYLVVNGKERKVFDGMLDPRKPLSIHQTETERKHEEEEEEEEYDEDEDFDLFNEEDFFEEEEEEDFFDEEDEY